MPLTAADFVTYPPALGPGDAIVGISSSGEFRDVVVAAERHRGRVPFAAIVHVPGSTLTGLASDVLLSAGGPSTVPVMTKTFSATLAATELLLVELLGDAAGRRAPGRAPRGRRTRPRPPSPPPSRSSSRSRTGCATSATCS